MKRRIGITLIVVLGSALVALIGASLYVRTARTAVAGERVVPGLSQTVEIWRDSLGVPHVFADAELDLFFAQGWLHAQDRLWQMELFRRVAAGRLAEILGPDLIESDRFLRTVGAWRAARAQEAAMGDATRARLQAYVEGVNAWIAGHRGALPPEFLALRFRPEPWTVAHSLAIEKVMAWDLSAWGSAVSAARAARLDPERARWLDVEWPAWAPDILDPPAVDAPALALQLLDAVSIARASNAWVIGGERTRSGRPILANDMHLALRAPSIWYLMALHGGLWNVTGMSLPGVPFIVAGHNDAVAWGFTNAMLDDIDLFLERVDPADSTRYLVPGGSEPFEIVAETIEVRGAAAVSFEIRLTRHGPILETIGDPAGRDLVALRWAAQDPSRTLDAVPALNLARDALDVVTAVRLFENPHQNVVYADTAGNFGYVMGGRIPRRGEGRPPPDAPVPGWTGEWDWNGWLPFEAHPQAHNPAAGYVVTANHRQVAGEAGALVSRHWEPPFRAARIRAMIEAAAELDADAVHAMQMDVRDALAERFRDLAVTAAREAGNASGAAVLAGWDLEARADSRGAGLFYIWYERLRRGVRDHLWGGRDGPLPTDAYIDILDRQALPWDAEPAEAFRALAVRAAIEADSLAGGRDWGELHTVRSAHALSSSPLLERLLGLDVGGVPAGGSPTTVNVSQYDGGTTPIRAAYGPSQRHVVDLGDVDGAGGFILPTGQSGLPFDRHYRDQWPRWLAGGLWRIPLDPSEASPRAVHRLLLRPAQSGR